MESILQSIWTGIIETSTTEWLAVIISTLYVLFIAGKNRWGWVLAIVSSSLYIYLAYIEKLFIQTGLQFFYLIMAVYGWIAWNKAKDVNQFIQRWNLKKHGIIIIVGCVVALVMGLVMDRFTNQNNAYLDSFTTVFSLAATLMSTQRVLENWLYWIVIDSALIFLFIFQGYYLIGIHYFVYTIIAIFAFFSWRKAYKNYSES